MNEKLESHYNNFLSYLTDKKVENRPIVTGNFARQPIFQFLNLNIKPEEYKGAEVLHKRGFFIGLPTEILDRSKINRITNLLLNVNNF